MSITNYIMVLACFLVVESCSYGSEKESSASAPVEDKKETHTIEMAQMKFNPAELTVKKGDKVIFVNHDIVAHDVTETSTKAWNSDPMADGQSWTLVATKSVDYHCSIHPVMKGKIVVE